MRIQRSENTDSRFWLALKMKGMGTFPDFLGKYEKNKTITSNNIKIMTRMLWLLYVSQMNIHVSDAEEFSE